MKALPDSIVCGSLEYERRYKNIRQAQISENANSQMVIEHATFQWPVWWSNYGATETMKESKGYKYLVVRFYGKRYDDIHQAQILRKCFCPKLGIEPRPFWLRVWPLYNELSETQRESE